MPTFTITKDHIKMMQALCFTWEDCEYGGPAVDCKRPFGNSGRHQIVLDMAQVMGIPQEKIMDLQGELIEPEAERLEALYRDMEKVLAIVMRTLSFEPGTYEAAPYSSKWKRVGNPHATGDSTTGGAGA